MYTTHTKAKMKTACTVDDAILPSFIIIASCSGPSGFGDHLSNVTLWVNLPLTLWVRFASMAPRHGRLPVSPLGPPLPISRTPSPRSCGVNRFWSEWIPR